ncbi:hypothetical protein [Culex mosquito virus 3]|nr:hypothetical protein [Culex mosquito virus 3]
MFSHFAKKIYRGGGLTSPYQVVMLPLTEDEEPDWDGVCISSETSSN